MMEQRLGSASVVINTPAATDAQYTTHRLRRTGPPLLGGLPEPYLAAAASDRPAKRRRRRRRGRGGGSAVTGGHPPPAENAPGLCRWLEQLADELRLGGGGEKYWPVVQPLEQPDPPALAGLAGSGGQIREVARAAAAPAVAGNPDTVDRRLRLALAAAEEGGSGAATATAAAVPAEFVLPPSARCGRDSPCCAPSPRTEWAVAGTCWRR